jgi:hypothetical protein
MDCDISGLVVLVFGLIASGVFAVLVVKAVNSPCGEEIQKPGHRTSDSNTQKNCGSTDDPQFDIKTMCEAPE